MSKQLRVSKYSFLLNPHKYTRLSTCPFCDNPTHPRKFPLVIHVDQGALMVMGKTCKYCSKHKLVICHQDELDTELAYTFTTLKPEAIGNPYEILGTMDLKIWKGSLITPLTTTETFDHLEVFKKIFTRLRVNRLAENDRSNAGLCILGCGARLLGTQAYASLEQPAGLFRFFPALPYHRRTFA